MKKLTDMTPYVGDALPYVYDGSSNEHLRAGSVYAFHLFTEGPGEMEIEGIRYPLERRTLVFLRPGQPHAFHISRQRPLASYNLYCDLWDRDHPVSPQRGFVAAPEPLVLPQQAAVYPCEELDGLPGIFSLQSHPYLYDEFVQMAKVYSETHYFRQDILNSMLYAWMLNWYNAIHTPQPSDYRILRLLALLEHQPEKRDPVEEWWKLCGLKRTYFHELFRRETGFTPKAYQHRLWMKRAVHLLKESDLSITAIADRLGYPSIHPFSRHFTAYYGVSPREYRLKPRREL